MVGTLFKKLFWNKRVLMRIVFAHRFAPVQPGADKVDLIHCRQMRFDGSQFRVADFFVRVRTGGFKDGDGKLVES